MRKSHRQKVADRRKKRQRRVRQKFYNGLVEKFKGQLKKMQADPLAFAKEFGRPSMIMDSWQSPPQFPRADLSITQRKLSPGYIDSIGFTMRVLGPLSGGLLSACPGLFVMDDMEKASKISDGFLEEKSSAYAKDAAEKALIGPIISAVHEPEVVGVDPAANAAGKTFIDALISAVAADNPERFLSSFESLNPGLLERVCPECEGTGWSYHEHLPIERHVGCEDCGGCGDERGTGITP